MGISYKEGIDDTRESPAFDIMLLLGQYGARVCFYDPYVERLEEAPDIERIEYTKENIERIDCAIIVTGHREIDYSILVKYCGLIFDSRNILKGMTDSNIVRL